MPQRISAAGMSCVFEGTHEQTAALPEIREKSSSIPLSGTMRAREPVRILVLVPYPNWGQALTGICALAGGRLGTASAQLQPQCDMAASRRFQTMRHGAQPYC
jgi:hypothetical protein